MGLTIHYDLALPAKTLLPDVRQKLGALRQTCLDLPFKEVGEPIELNGEECNFEKRDREDPLRWFLIQSDTTVHFKYDRSGKTVAVSGHGRVRAAKRPMLACADSPRRRLSRTSGRERIIGCRLATASGVGVPSARRSMQTAPSAGASRISCAAT